MSPTNQHDRYRSDEHFEFPPAYSTAPALPPACPTNCARNACQMTSVVSTQVSKGLGYMQTWSPPLTFGPSEWAVG